MMRIVIAGAGTVGVSIARELLSHKHEVTLMDKLSSRMRVSMVAEADWILADACSPKALADADVANCDVMVAATGDDKANLVISLLSKTEFGVPRVVARINNPKNEWLFNESWGVDVSVSTPRIMTALVEEALSVGRLVPIFEFNQSASTMYAITVPANSQVIGRRLGDLNLPPSTVISAILRDTHPYAPNPDMPIEELDQLLLLVAAQGADDAQIIQDLVNSENE